MSKPTRHYTITHHGLSISITLCVSPSSRGSLLSRLIGRQTTGRSCLFSLLESFGGPASFGMTTTLRMMRMIYIIWWLWRRHRPLSLQAEALDCAMRVEHPRPPPPRPAPTTSLLGSYWIVSVTVAKRNKEKKKPFHAENNCVLNKKANKKYLWLCNS